MSTNPNPQALARDGLRQLEDAILRLLDANPSGLRNVAIARGLGLSFDFGGRYKNQLTYAVLGGLLSRGVISHDPDTKLFTSIKPDTAQLETAQAGLRYIEDAVLQLLLDVHPQGLRNVDIAERLGLRSDFRGGQKDYLTYTVLVRLREQGRVRREGQLYTTA